jgi:hypothetical protein
MADSAVDIIKNTLKFYGLTDQAFLDQVDASWRDQTISADDDINTIGIKLKDTDAFKKRFPANELLKQRGQQQFTVSQYLTLEADFKRTLQSRGMPTGFYDDPTDFQNWIATDTSPDEVAARIDQGYQAVRNAPKNVVAEFQRLYGATEGDLAAYFIDPQRARPLFDRYEAERQARAAQISAQAQQQAQMQLDVQQSEALARAGITAEQAQAGFSQISQQEQLFQAQMVGEQAVSQEQQIAGTFGINAEARKAIEARRRRRQAAFETGGGFAGQGQASATGLTTVGQ